MWKSSANVYKMKNTLKEVTSINKGICGDIFFSCLSTVQLNVFNLCLYYCVDNMFCLYFLKRENKQLFSSCFVVHKKGKCTAELYFVAL